MLIFLMWYYYNRYQIPCMQFFPKHPGANNKKMGVICLINIVPSVFHLDKKNRYFFLIIKITFRKISDALDPRLPPFVLESLGW